MRIVPVAVIIYLFCCCYIWLVVVFCIRLKYLRDVFCMHPMCLRFELICIGNGRQICWQGQNNINCIHHKIKKKKKWRANSDEETHSRIVRNIVYIYIYAYTLLHCIMKWKIKIVSIWIHTHNELFTFTVIVYFVGVILMLWLFSVVTIQPDWLTYETKLKLLQKPMDWMGLSFARVLRHAHISRSNQRRTDRWYVLYVPAIVVGVAWCSVWCSADWREKEHREKNFMQAAGMLRSYGSVSNCPQRLRESFSHLFFSW